MSSKCGGERRGGRPKAKSMDTTVLFPPIHVSHATNPGSGPRAPPRNKMALYEHVTTPSARNRHFMTAPGGAIENRGMSSQLPTAKEHVAAPSSAYERRFEYPSFHAVAAANRASWAHQWSAGSNATCPPDQLIATPTSQPWCGQSGSSGVSLVTRQGRGLEGAQPPQAERRRRSVHVTQVSMDSCTVNGTPPLAAYQVAKEAPPSGLDSCRRQESSATTGWNTPGITPKRFFLERHIEDSRQSESMVAGRHVEQGEGMNEDGLDECPGSPGTSSEGGLSEQSPPIESRNKEEAQAVEGVGPLRMVARIGQQDFWKARKTVIRQQRILSAQVFELHRLLQVQRDLFPPSCHFPLSGPRPPAAEETPSWPSIPSTPTPPTSQFAYPAYTTVTQSTCALNPTHAHSEKVVAIAMVRQGGMQRVEGRGEAAAGWMGVGRLAEECDRVEGWSNAAPQERRHSHPQRSEASTISGQPVGGPWGEGGKPSTGMHSGAGREWAHGWGSTPCREWEGGGVGGEVGEERVGEGVGRELELFPLVPACDDGGPGPRMGTKIVPRALVGTPESTAGILASIQRRE